MAVPRFYCADLALGLGEQVLPERVAHHAVRVLRMSAGDELVLFDGLGKQACGRLQRLETGWGVHCSEVTTQSRESPLEIVLVQGMPAADKMDWVIQKAVELGVRAIQPVSAERSVVRLSEERAVKRALHWQQVMISACEQCGRNVLPELRPLVSLSGYLGTPLHNAKRFVMDPADGNGIRQLATPQAGQAVHVLIGPEGGWSARELASCHAAGSLGLTLGPRVLRTETAGLAVVAAMQALWGDF